MEKRRYFKFDDESQYRDFNYRTWSNLTPYEQLMWQALGDPWDDEKKFVQYRDEKIIRHFSERIWNRLTEDERFLWKPFDDSDFPEPYVEKRSKDEIRKQMSETMSKKSMDNLRVKEGQRVDMMGRAGEILKWGHRAYLLRHWKKSSPESVRYGTMPRLVRNSSWGDQDTLTDRMSYSSFSTLVQAEAEYDRLNK